MSFICQGGCGKPQLPGIYPVKKVVKRREKRDHSFEIVKEIDCCPRCKHINHKLITVPFEHHVAAAQQVFSTSDLKRHFNRR